MGSGTAICRAIKKYGIKNFKKEILAEFDRETAAYEFEATVVTEDFVARIDTYNLRVGGVGGWSHINKEPKATRRNLQALREKAQNGEYINQGGTKNWTADSWAKVRANGWSALRARGIISDTSPWHALTDQQKAIYRAKISNAMSADGNPMHGTHLYIDAEYQGEIPPMPALNQSHRFNEGEQPVGWILLSVWRDQFKNKKSAAYGRSWYNDGNQNHYLYPTDAKITELNLRKGRMKH